VLPRRPRARDGSAGGRCAAAGLDAAVLYFTLRLLNLSTSEILELPAFR
jgi:hypothetical protein